MSERFREARRVGPSPVSGMYGAGQLAARYGPNLGGSGRLLHTGEK